MSMGLALQYGLIALAVIASVAVVVRKQFPGVERALRGRLALWLLKPQRRAGLQRFGRWLAPSSRAAGSCGGCDGCGPGSPKQH